ncbi:putative aquaporin NIP-type [Porphyridium purpureum]|uniref:Putative aquaporin NIP-type n=1 Tax=Porphyridium purpureum TaxID=35688 RepID=A0A5J4YYV8_PORPP|nr:putative aquaporin NIP-type [Porphyridium purpureum]|eukprot:POR3797..scf208_2
MAHEEFRQKFGAGVMEALGTMVLVMTIQLAVTAGMSEAPAVIGVVLMIMVYCGGPISGANYNPAVSIALWMRGRLDTVQAFTVYIPFQIAGGVLGALLGLVINGKAIAPSVGVGYHWIQAMIVEITFTALLCFVVLAVATNSKTEGNSFFGAAIGLTVTVGAACVGHISGGCFNPAVALGLTLIKHFWKPMYALTVVAANIVGALIGTALFYICAPSEFEHFSSDSHGALDEAKGLLSKQ